MHNVSYGSGEFVVNISTILNFSETNSHKDSSDFPYISETGADVLYISVGSNLTQTINATITLSPYSCLLSAISYKSASGNYTQQWIFPSCSLDPTPLVTLSVIGIEGNVTNNTFSFSYFGGGGQGTGIGAGGGGSTAEGTTNASLNITAEANKTAQDSNETLLFDEIYLPEIVSNFRDWIKENLIKYPYAILIGICIVLIMLTTSKVKRRKNETQ